MAKLTVVTQDTPAPVPASLKDAVEMSERALLVAMRRRVAGEIDTGVPPHALAGLVRQLRDLDKEIRLLDAREAEEVAKRGGAPDESFDASAV